MLEPSGPKKPPISENQIQMQLSDEEFSSTFSPLFSTSCPSRKDKDKDIKMEEITEQSPTKRGRSQSSFRKKNQNKKKAKPRSTIASILFLCLQDNTYMRP